MKNKQEVMQEIYDVRKELYEEMKDMSDDECCTYITKLAQDAFAEHKMIPQRPTKINGRYIPIENPQQQS